MAPTTAAAKPAPASSLSLDTTAPTTMKPAPMTAPPAMDTTSVRHSTWPKTAPRDGARGRGTSGW